MVCEGCFSELKYANKPGQEVGVMKWKVPEKSGMFLLLWPLLLGRGGGGCLWSAGIHSTVDFVRGATKPICKLHFNTALQEFCSLPLLPWWQKDLNDPTFVAMLIYLLEITFELNAKQLIWSRLGKSHVWLCSNSSWRYFTKRNAENVPPYIQLVHMIWSCHF